MFCVIGKHEGDWEYRCYPYRKSTFRCALMIMTHIFSAGLTWLIFYWRPDWKLRFTHYLTSFDDCTSVYLEHLDGTERVYVCKIQVADGNLKRCAPHLFSILSGVSQAYHKNTNIENQHNNSLKKASSLSNSAINSVDKGLVKYFILHLTKYIWDANTQTFVKVEGYDGNVNLDEVHTLADNPLSEENAKVRRELYGENAMHVEIPSYISLLVAEVLNPFYVFQIFACILWIFELDFSYSLAILITSFISAVVSLISIRRERVALHDMVEKHNMARISVVRNIRDRTESTGSSTSREGVPAKEYITEDIQIKDLVPGDVVVIPSSRAQLSFDAALISGSCIVNESMLTGESVPVTKTPLPSGESELSKTFDIDELKPHVLFCGTEVVQTRYYQEEIVRAVVVRTGYGTAKGQLVQDILFPKPVNLKLLRDAYKFLGVLFIIAIIGMAYSVYTLIQGELPAWQITIRTLDVLTITVPPALPLALTIGIIYAQNRLKKGYIHTISPQRINICGQVDVVAFDKTGTLTEAGLNIAHILPALSGRFDDPLQPDDLKTWDKKSDLVRSMATCHSLTVIKGETSGDPLDIEMFEATGFELVERKVDELCQYDQLQVTMVRPKTLASDLDLSKKLEEVSEAFDGINESLSEYEIGLVRIFPFLSSLKRASVIVKSLTSEPTDMVVYVKGAPETIAKLCIPETVPRDFMHALKAHTEKGYRVIALSTRSMKMKWQNAQKIERESVEKNLTFLGLIIFQNKLKPASQGVIDLLEKANIRSIMVTGDNLETAVSVGVDCKILKPWRTIFRVTCDVSGTYPSLKCYCVNKGNSKMSVTFSSSDDLTKTIISVGDNAIEEKCHLVVTGSDYAIIKKYFPQFVKALAVQGAIFARMSPAQKTELMEELEAVDCYTLMCGDGANDCGALKRAHVGLSLSELEASVAAPFTASVDNGIGSVVSLIREGRAALVTSFGMFKFMALYSMIQFTTVLLLYTNITIISNFQFLYIDLFVISFLALTMSRNHAYKSLHGRKPPASLVSSEMLLTVLLQIFLQMGLQLCVFLFVQQQCWYRGPIVSNETSGGIIPIATHNSIGQYSTDEVMDNSSCPALANADYVTSPAEATPKTYETTALFYVSCFMYVSVSVAFSHGKPFRTAIYKNRLLLSSILILTAFQLFMMFGAPLEFNEFMMLWRIPDMSFLAILCGVIVLHFILSLLIERFFIENPCLWNMIKSFICSETTQKKQYKKIEHLGQNIRLEVINDNLGGEIAFPAHYEGQVLHSKISTEGRTSISEMQTQL